MRIGLSFKMHQTASPYIPPNFQEYSCLQSVSLENGDAHYEDNWTCNLNHVALLPATVTPVSQNGASFDSSFTNYYSLSGANNYYINTSINSELSDADYNNLHSTSTSTATTLVPASTCSATPDALDGYNHYCPPNSENVNYYMQDNIPHPMPNGEHDQCQSAFLDPSITESNGAIWSNCSSGDYIDGSAVAIGGGGYRGESYTVSDSVDSYSSNVSVNQGPSQVVQHNHTYSTLDGPISNGTIDGIINGEQNGHYHRLLPSISSSHRLNNHHHIHHNHHHHHHHHASSSRGSRSSDLKSSLSDTSDEDAISSKDEKRAKDMNIPISLDDIINLPIDEFNERLTKYELNEAQLSLIRDIRRRGKNKVAAQNCRRRKMDQIMDLQGEVKSLYAQKKAFELEQEHLIALRHLAEEKYNKLYQFIFPNPSGNAPVTTYEGLNEYSQPQIMVSQNSSTTN